jgi:hypothetical protein
LPAEWNEDDPRDLRVIQSNLRQIVLQILKGLRNEAHRRSPWLRAGTGGSIRESACLSTIQLKPRPASLGYAAAAARSMTGDHWPMVAELVAMLRARQPK